MRGWLESHWVGGAFFMGLAFLALVPVLYGSWPWPMLLVFLHAPAYMIHQVEEHEQDRFRTYVNRHVFGGLEALTADMVLWINIPVVWGLTLAALYAAWFIAPGWGLLAPWLVIVNALTHIGNALARRSYNPGLVTSIVLFLPLGIAALRAIPATPGEMLVALGLSLLVHVMIVVAVLRHARQLRGA